ncbi:ABC transporter ATP-binding protein [Sulfitobacter sp. F26204]|uniref:ABC transporter ATP-binding protein n=1 Tax=Sulfitobacter sp. F26204 TaxID=2996014 RepID=UPI00225E6828|nr:ABC transporter ATP-binding protein [Sulfitobacter sp. F26204]MCX7560682.1 ABC transporter ATP-binding protein [Sulfitobacter sp. F26204]
MSDGNIKRSGAKAPETSTESGPVLRLDHLNISVNTEDGLRPLVHDLSFDLHRGETLAIAGESGSGKSLTSLAIMGLLPPPAVRVTGGSIHFGEQELTTLGESALRQIRGNRIAMIFQEPMTSLNPVMKIGTQLAEAICAHESISFKDARARALAALKSVRLSEPEKRLNQFPHELSGGMRQRVMIAMALALKPDILIADEPTTALDVTVQREVLDLLRDLQREMGTALILITHDMGVVAEMADRVLVMKGGHFVEENDVVSLFSQPREAYTRDLLNAVPCLGDGLASASANKPNEDPYVAELENVVVRFNVRSGILGRVTHRVHAVENVSLNIRKGEIFSLVGESGCGKSTIAKAMVGLVKHSGRIRINGIDISPPYGTIDNQVRREIQMVFQDPMASLDPRMRVGELVREPLVIHGVGSVAEQKRRVEYLFERVGLSRDQIERYPHEFSGGQRQRICIARALALNPKLIIADESVSALDVTVQAKVLVLLKELVSDLGVSFLFISHDMAVVENISDRVAVMYLGQIVEMGSCQQIFGTPRHSYTRRLISAVPTADPTRERQTLARLVGDVPSPVRLISETVPHVTLENAGNGHMIAIE